MKIMRRRPEFLWKQMRRRPDFFDQVLMDSLSYWYNEVKIAFIIAQKEWWWLLLLSLLEK